MSHDARDQPGGPPDIRGHSELERAAIIETSIQQAIRRGEFDDLPGSGKPIEGLDGKSDPDWWIRRKIENENLTGLGPPALSLRVENAELDDRLDGMSRAEDVREALEDFNSRVVSARRQLQGGPPVVTPTREVATEIAAWRTRRAERQAAAKVEPPQPETPAERPRRRWFGLRR